MFVRLTKLTGPDKPKVPVGYWVEGRITGAPTLGKRITLDPFNKDSLHNNFDWFSTSIVTGFDNGIVTTMNSTYKYEELK